MKIEIDDEVWDLYRRSWALFGVRAESELINFLECNLREESINVLENAEEELVSNEPEALVRREIGLMRELRKQKLQGKKK